jgi:parallel beta-helix repeat protein
MPKSPVSSSSVARVLLAGLICLLAGGAKAAAISSVTLPANATGEQIQAALNSFGASGGEVVLPAGTFTIHEPIVLQHDHLTLRGAGSDTILFLANNANCPVVVLGVPESPSPRPVKNLHLAHLFIDGNRSHQQVELWRRLKDGSVINNNGVEVRNVRDTTVEGVVCARCRSGGLVTSAVNRHLTVHNFTSFDNQFDGLACYLTEDSQFSELNLHDNLCAGISLDLSFNRNTISDAVLTNNDLGIFMRQSSGNSFTNLTIRHSRHHGVFMAQSAVCDAKGWSLAPGTECTDNKFSDLMISNSGGKAFVVNDTSCTNNVLDQCRFEDNSKGGLFQPKTHPVLATALIER